MNADRYGWVGEEYRTQVSTQSYGERVAIAGVKRIELRHFSDEGGDFCEITRFGEDGTLAVFPGYRPAQLSYSLMEPGTVKAWHLHRRQDDLWFLPAGPRLLVGLLDVREDSETYRTSMRVALGTGRPCLLFIPRGVAHGVANLGTGPASVLYFVSEAFDTEHPDEHRLPADLLGDRFWAIPPG